MHLCVGDVTKKELCPAALLLQYKNPHPCCDSTAKARNLLLLASPVSNSGKYISISL